MTGAAYHAELHPSEIGRESLSLGLRDELVAVLRLTDRRVIKRLPEIALPPSKKGGPRARPFFLPSERNRKQTKEKQNETTTRMRKDVQDLWLLAEPYVRDAGFDLIEVQYGREPQGWVVRLFIDTPATAGVGPVTTGVGLDDCERVSRDVSAALDVADSVPHAYQLEVSSPGLDRPLRRERDFARFVGESARIRLNDGVEGRRNFLGTLQAAKDGHVEIACDGRSYTLPIDDIQKANLVPDWEREFHRSAS
jgi:ribosome maturation factor RimP